MARKLIEWLTFCSADQKKNKEKLKTNKALKYKWELKSNRIFSKQLNTSIIPKRRKKRKGFCYRNGKKIRHSKSISLDDRHKLKRKDRCLSNTIKFLRAIRTACYAIVSFFVVVVVWHWFCFFFFSQINSSGFVSVFGVMLACSRQVALLVNCCLLKYISMQNWNAKVEIGWFLCCGCVCV